MRRFFAERMENGVAVFSKEEAAHMARVLRLRAGDRVIVPLDGMDYTAVLEQVGEGGVTARLLESQPCLAEPEKSLVLYAAYTKADKLELVVQKAVELGVRRVCPFVSRNCVRVPEGAAAEKARMRMARIADEAVKQCGRARRVEIAPWIPFDRLLEQLTAHEHVVFAYECATGSLHAALQTDARDIALIVGAEGGFAPDEAERIVAAGGIPVSLGPRILRAETAAIALMAVAAYETGC